MPRPPFNQDVITRNNYLKTLSEDNLRQLAKQAGVTGWNTFTQKELIDVLTQLSLTSNPFSTNTRDNIQ